MLRFTFFVNVVLGIACLGVLYLLISIKSQIAAELRQVDRLNRDLDTEFTRQDALKAEWARLQRRAHLRTLGQARFGNAVSEVAQETHVDDLPARRTSGTGHDQALRLFAQAIVLMSERRPQTHDPLPFSLSNLRKRSDPIAALILADLTP